MRTIPVTASTLSEKYLGDFIKEKYGLDNTFECKLFRTGLNHTYFISNEITKFVVRVYCHNWRSKNEIQEELKLLKLLKNNNISVSFPIYDKEDNLIQSIKAPEGLRHIVVFSFAKGQKLRSMSNDTCSEIGSIMARIHTLTENSSIDRLTYNHDILLNESYNHLISFFSENLDEMKYLKKIGNQISKSFQEISILNFQKGIVHLDIWYDNLSVSDANEITIFDFDNCGNGHFILDISYFCKQLFFIESNKEEYESKVKSFLNGYQSIKHISDTEIKFIPEAGASIFVFYLGVQAQRFDWSNIFLSESYLKIFVGRIKTWLDYNTNKP